MRHHAGQRLAAPALCCANYRLLRDTRQRRAPVVSGAPRSASARPAEARVDERHLRCQYLYLCTSKASKLSTCSLLCCRCPHVLLYIQRPHTSIYLAPTFSHARVLCYISTGPYSDICVRILMCCRVQCSTFLTPLLTQTRSLRAGRSRCLREHSCMCP